MSNKNYVKGRAFEYKRKKAWERDGYIVLRTSGSHGFADLIAVKPGYPPVFIQCKVTKQWSVAAKLARDFRKTPPLVTSPHYRQCIEVWETTGRVLSQDIQ